MDLSIQEHVALPVKRPLSPLLDDSPMSKKPALEFATTDSELDDEYLDDLERRLDEKLGAEKDFDELMFMKSPHDSIMIAESISSENFRMLAEELSKLPDGDELIQFAEFLTTTNA